MLFNNRFRVVSVDQFRFCIFEGATYTKHDHGELGKQIHVFFLRDNHEFRFTINAKIQSDSPKEIITGLYEINAPLSLLEWCVAPYALTNSLTEGWACAYGLMEGEGMRIHKAVFENDEEHAIWTFSCPYSFYQDGYEIYEKCLRSFTFIEQNGGDA